MIPGKRHAKAWLSNLYSLLSIIISELYIEINAVINESNAHDEEMLWKSLLG